MKIFSCKRIVAAIMACSALAASAADIDMGTSVVAFYEGVNSKLANYYVVLSSNTTTRYSSSTGTVSMTGEGYMLTLDLYAVPSISKPIRIPGGTYTDGDGSREFTYSADTEYTYLMRFNSEGNAVAAYGISDPVELTVDDNGNYSISVNVKVDGKSTSVSFNGQIPFEDTQETPLVWPQIKQDLDMTFTNARAVYDGNLWGSNTGEFYLSFSDVELTEGGTMSVAGGTRYAIMLFNKLFSNSKEAAIMEGVYSPAKNFKRETFYPGCEMDYMGMTFPMGFYVQKHMPGIAEDSNMGYSYVTDGTVTITIGEDGLYDVVIDCVSSYGHKIRGTYHGEIPVTDQSDDKSSGAHISTLENDVECDLEQIPVARLQYAGVNGNPTQCHSLILDIGSPSGKDQALVDNGGDIMRFEFLQSLDQPYLLEGTYTVMEEPWSNYYAPFRLAQGHWSKTALGDLSGTRYMHFIEGRYLVMDHLAPAVEGTVGVTKNADDTYTIKFHLIDDAYFYITGEWTGPVQYTYDPKEVLASTVAIESGIADVTLTRTGADTYRLENLRPGASVEVVGINGFSASVTPDTEGIISMAGFANGIYIIRADNKSFKISK